MSSVKHLPPIGIRWTIGDVSDAGYEALRLSLWSAWNVFGEHARYAVCVNTISARVAAARVGEVPCRVNWIAASDIVPAWLRTYITPEMAEGVAWKFMPVRVFPAMEQI